MLKKIAGVFKPKPPGAYKGLYITSANDFLEKLSLKGIAPLGWAELDDFQTGETLLQEGIQFVMESSGLLIWMKRNQTNFDSSFMEVHKKMGILKVKDVEKHLDKNKVNWVWRWDQDGYRCLLTYWNFVDIRKGEGIELFIRPKRLKNEIPE
ncbi:MAG: hypothetical protein QNL04_01280 [SAR324 cluster bacterium]|nr:hypothetical protein [SAR324 cluster bacterium]